MPFSMDEREPDFAEGSRYVYDRVVAELSNLQVLTRFSHLPERDFSWAIANLSPELAAELTATRQAYVAAYLQMGLDPSFAGIPSLASDSQTTQYFSVDSGSDRDTA